LELDAAENTLASGWVLNFGIIKNTVVRGGVVSNFGGDGRGNVPAYDMKWFDANQKTAVMESVELCGGVVQNTSKIENLYYAGGTYHGDRANSGTSSLSLGLGIVNTLTLATDARNNSGDWGIVENLAFASDGSGFITVNGFRVCP
jgi:hypothetical protein